MSKPNKERINTNATAQLTHNPFAALDTKAGAPPIGSGDAPPLIPVSNASASLGNKPGRVVLRRETAHRGGKSVIVVDDFAEHIGESFIEELSKKLRKSCGCGGAVKGRRIELQGDQPEKIRALLQAEGFRVAGI